MTGTAHCTMLKGVCYPSAGLAKCLQMQRIVLKTMVLRQAFQPNAFFILPTYATWLDCTPREVDSIINFAGRSTCAIARACHSPPGYRCRQSLVEQRAIQCDVTPCDYDAATCAARLCVDAFST